MNLLHAFIGEANVHARRTAIIAANGERASYGDLLVRSSRLSAAWRRKGIAAGDRVLLAMPVGILLYASLIALWRLGAVIVFPEPALGLKGFRHAVAVTKPSAFVSSGWFTALHHVWPELWPIRSLLPDEECLGSDAIETVAADHPALISFTSGSTGKAKTIVRSHDFLIRQNASVAELLRSERDEVDLVAFPVFVLANLGLGATSVLPNWNLRRHHTARPERIAEHIREHRVTRALIPPSICEKLTLVRRLDLRAIFTGGGPVFPDLLQRLCANIADVDVVSVYGSTEAEPIAHQRMLDICVADWLAMRNGAGLLSGRPSAGIDMKLLKSEILVTGPHVNKGYLDPADDITTKLRHDGRIWHRTGDAGRLDETGRLWLLGRMDGRAGDLFPFCVETAARFWPNVAKAALVAIEGKPVLAIEGNPGSHDIWQSEAARFGDIRVVGVRRMPLDRRHRAKIDYPVLKKLLRTA